ncbi:MAG: hypothetical protein Q9159_006984 [Coniocarpon cinnabarinum]
MSIITPDDHIALARAKSETKLLLNNDLKSILREQGLAISGLQELYDQGEAEDFRKLCQRVAPPAPASSASATSNGFMAPNYPDRYAPGYRSSGGYYGGSSAYPSAYSNSNYGRPSGGTSHMRFPNTPFHEILEPLTRNTDLPVVHQNRHTINASFTLGPEKQSQMQHNNAFRVLLYCTSDFDLPRPDVGFPSQIEVKVNDEAFQGNLRGIKKKAGTTRPADITSLVRKLPNYQNRVAVTYAATDKKFFFVVNYVRKYAVQELVAKIKRGSVITKEKVINEMISKANDADIVATSSVMSLKCPLSAMRMTLPCRSTICNHNQCFDAESFLQLQEQAPQWSCPTCNKVFPFEALAVDQYVQDILQRFPKSVDQVTIEPDGAVKNGDTVANMSTDGPAPPGSTSPGYDSEQDGDVAGNEEDDDDDDIIEIRGGRPQPVKNEPSSATTPFTFQPFARSQATSRMSSAPSSVATSTNSAKRKQTEVVDLTLSSDEDEGERIRQPPIKRSSTSRALSSSFNSTLPTLGSKPLSSQSIPQSPRPPHPSPLPRWGSPYRQQLSQSSSLQFGGQTMPSRSQSSNMQSSSWNQAQPPSYANYGSYNPWGLHR